MPYDCTAIAIAARRGRGDFLAELRRRDIAFGLQGRDALLAACAMDEAPATRDPKALGAIVEQGGQPLAEFAGNGNCEGVRRLLDLGVPVSARFARVVVRRSGLRARIIDRLTAAAA